MTQLLTWWYAARDDAYFWEHSEEAKMRKTRKVAAGIMEMMQKSGKKTMDASALLGIG